MHRQGAMYEQIRSMISTQQYCHLKQGGVCARLKPVFIQHEYDDPLLCFILNLIQDLQHRAEMLTRGEAD